MNNISEILSIYERIIYGDLRPWIEENLDDKIFHELLHPSIIIDKSNIETFENELNEKLRKHPLYSTFESFKIILDTDTNTFEVSNPEDEHFDELIDISIPPSFDDKTEYYYLVLRYANKKILKSIGECFTNAISKDDFSFFINKLFAKLKLIIYDTHLKEKSINYDGKLDFAKDEITYKDKLRKVDHYILSATRERLLQLMLEIQIFYKDYFDVILSEKSIYHEVLHDKHPADGFIFRMPRIENYSVDVFFKKLHEYDLEAVKNRIDRLKKCINDIGGYVTIDDEINKSKTLLLDNIFILENLIYFKTYINDSTELSRESLSNQELIAQWYQTYKESIKAEISDHSNSVEILDLLIQLQEKNNSLLTKIPFDKHVNVKNSLLRMQCVWFEEQINFYKVNLAINPSALQPSNSSINKTPTNLSVKELAFLFKALYELKIIHPQTKTDLFKQIANNFTTKGNDELSWKSIKNHFDTPDQKAADEWVTYFTQLMQFSKKFRENS